MFRPAKAVLPMENDRGIMSFRKARVVHTPRTIIGLFYLSAINRTLC